MTPSGIEPATFWLVAKCIINKVSGKKTLLHDRQLILLICFLLTQQYVCQSLYFCLKKLFCGYYYVCMSTDINN